MLLVLLTACDDDDALRAAVLRTDAFLEAHPRGTAIAQASADGERLAGVVGTGWHGADLAEWLAPCGPADEANADAQLVLEPGRSPREVTSAGSLDACVRERLATFPFEEPSRRGQRDLVVVRWRPAEVAEPFEEDGRAADAAPRGLWSQAPPYWRVSLDGERLWGEGFDVVDGRLLLPPIRDARVAEGSLADAETWARQLTCPGEGALGLVRVALGFQDGSLEVLETVPEDDCVGEKVRESRRWMRDQPLGTTVLRDAPYAIVVIDVPVGAW